MQGRPDERTQQPSLRTKALVLLLLFCVSALLYGRTVRYYFSGDTFDFLGPPNKANLTRALLRPEVSYTYRPVPRLLWLLQFELWGRDPFWYHVLNIASHAFCALLLFLVAMRLHPDTLWATIAALLFVVMPVHFDVVSTEYHWVEPLSTGLMLGAWLLYMRTASLGKNKLPWGAAALFLVALLTKQSTASLLLIIAAWEVLYNRAQEKLFHFLVTRALRCLPLLLALGIAAAANLLAKPSDEAVSMVLGISLSYRMPVFFLAGLVKAAKPWFLPAIAVLLIAPLLFGPRLARFSLLFVLLAPFPFYALNAERHMYLPGVGLAMAVAAFVRFGRGPAGQVGPSATPAADAASPRASHRNALLDFALLALLVAFFLVPYKAPSPGTPIDSGQVRWVSHLVPTYWQTAAAVINDTITRGQRHLPNLSANTTRLVVLSWINLVALVALGTFRLLFRPGPIDPRASKIVRFGLLAALLVVFACCTYSTVAADPRPEKYKEDAALRQLKKDYPELPDNTIVYVSPDSKLPLLGKIRFFYDLKQIQAKPYSEFFQAAALGQPAPDPSHMRCFSWENNRFVRRPGDELVLQTSLKEDWRPQYADFSLRLGSFGVPFAPSVEARDQRWSVQRFSPLHFRCAGSRADALTNKTALLAALDIPTLAANLLEVRLAGRARGTAVAKLWLLWQLDWSNEWRCRSFDLRCDGEPATFVLKLSATRDWYLARRLSGICLVPETELDVFRVDYLELSFGLRMGVGVVRFPGGDEQLRTAIEDILIVR